jgi:hypothetical protein
LTVIAKLRTPHAPVSEIEGHSRARSAGRLYAADCVIRFRRHTAMAFHCLWHNARLTSAPHRRTTRSHGYRAAMCSCSVLIHCPSRLGAAAAVLTAELPCRDGVFTKGAFERAKAVHHFDGVMSHRYKSSRFSQYYSELKYPLPCAGCDRHHIPVSLLWEFGRCDRNSSRKSHEQRRAELRARSAAVANRANVRRKAEVQR